MKLLPGPLRRRNGAATKEAEVEERARKEALQREKESAKERRRDTMLEIPIATLGWLDERLHDG